MNKLKFLIDRNDRVEYNRMYYQAYKHKWVEYRRTRVQKLKDLRPVIIFY